MTEHQAPSCPQCSLHLGVVAMEPPERRPGRDTAPMDCPSEWPWYCTDCRTVFTGTQAEWDRMQYQRTQYLNRSKPRGQR